MKLINYHNESLYQIKWLNDLVVGILINPTRKSSKKNHLNMDKFFNLNWWNQLQYKGRPNTA